MDGLFFSVQCVYSLLHSWSLISKMPLEWPLFLLGPMAIGYFFHFNSVPDSNQKLVYI